MKKEIKFIELFAGIEGFRYGLEKADKRFKCVWANDFDKFACKIYKKNYGDKLMFEGNIKNIKVNEIPKHDLLCAGFPCQPFSTAGNRKGFGHTKGTLFFEIIRIIKEQKTKYIFLENVKGLLSHDNGRTFKTIIYSLTKLGYNLQWQVLNSKYFGVPQNRERIFIIGHLGKNPFPEIFPIKTINKKDNLNIITLNQKKIKYNTFRILNINGIMSTILAGSKGIILDNNNIIRYLTPIERERLQGFPDNWTKGIPLSQRYKTTGNSVTTTVIEFIGKAIIRLSDKNISIEKYLENTLKNCELIKKDLYNKLLKKDNKIIKKHNWW